MSTHRQQPDASTRQVVPDLSTLATFTRAEPASVDDLATLIRERREQGGGLVDYGIAHQGVGGRPIAAAPDKLRLLDLAGLHTDPVLEHHVRDLTVRVSAGASFGEVQQVLADAGQFLPIDADPDLTIGEIINHQVYGPLRVGFGSVRDLLLGLSYMDANGQDIHVGGRTVKNVAGYDVTRFLVGSLGELGIIHEATLRTYAIPEATLSTTLHLDGTNKGDANKVSAFSTQAAEVDASMTRWLTSQAQPTRLALRMEHNAWRLDVGYFGSEASVLAQSTALSGLISDGTLPTGWRLELGEPHPLDNALRERSDSRAWHRRASTCVKLVVPPGKTGACGDQLRMHASAGGYLDALRIDALPVHGSLFAGGELAAEQALHLDKAIRDIIVNQFGGQRGFRVWYRRPAPVGDTAPHADASTIAPFWPTPPDQPMLVRIKQVLDPKNVFNPGRFLSHPDARISKPKAADCLSKSEVSSP